MGGIANARKNFRWTIEMDGVNMFQIQECQLPSIEFPVIANGAPNNMPDGKSPGKMKVGELVVKKLCPTFSADIWAWDWFAQGIIGDYSAWSKLAFLKDHGPDGISTVQTFVLGNIWPSKIEQSNRVTQGDGENLMETVTFQVQYFFPKESPAFAALFAGAGAGALGAGFASGRG